MRQEFLATDFDGDCGGECIQRAIDAADDESGRTVVAGGPDGPDGPDDAGGEVRILLDAA